jgi:CRP/FNR family transcriptional regulator
MGWANPPGDDVTRAELARLPEQAMLRGAALFRPGETAQAFPVVLSGRIEVHLTGPSGREILLYVVDPGESCVQTTLGLLGDELYGGEAVVAVPSRLVLVPRPLFLRLIDRDAGLRLFVLRAFGQRMAEVTRLLERVAFGRVEPRLAQALLELASDDTVQATQAELAARIGSAREVVSRRLEAWGRRGIVATDRGLVRLIDPAALRQLAADDP